jgi:hypothetical protein
MGKLTGQQHFPVVFACVQGVEVSPVARFGGTRNRHRLDLYRGLGGDFDLGVRSGNVEVMRRVPGEIAILRDIGGRVHVEMEAEAALVRFAQRMHAHFHDALADRGLVAESRDVPHRIDQRFSLSFTFPYSLNLSRTCHPSLRSG